MIKRDIVETTSELRGAAERLESESSQPWTPQSTRSLEALSERLVDRLLPNLAAFEAVVSPLLDAGSTDAVTRSHQRVRLLAERLAVVSEAVSRSRRPKSVSTHVRAVLRNLSQALKELERHQDAALSLLETGLSDMKQAEIARSLAAAGKDARARILLVTGPEVAPTESTVLRSRPDLDRAYATSLAELEAAPTESS